MSRTRKHHFVPQFLLRNFSTDKKTIKIGLLGRGLEVCGPIRGQCYEKYLHGKEGALEEAFGKIEDDASRIFNAVEGGGLQELSLEQDFAVRLFMNYQIQRTVGAMQKINQSFELMARVLLEKDSRVTTEMLNAVNINLTEPFAVTLKNAITSIPLLMDLEMKFIKNERDLDFIMSDNPAVLYDQFIEHHTVLSDRKGIGLAMKGLQIFLPISPKLCLLFFDGDTYRIGKKDALIVQLSRADIGSLNLLQVLNAHSNIYFLDGDRIGFSLDRLAREHSGYRDSRILVVKGPEKNEPNGKKSQIIQFIMLAHRIGTKFSFVMVTDRHHYRDYLLAMPPVRSKRLITIHRGYSDYIDRLIAENRPV